MAFRHTEFSLGIRHRYPDRGSYPRVDVPGFYMYAGFANEGEADWIIEDRLLPPETLQRIGDELADILEVPRLGSAMAQLGIDADIERTERLSALRDQQARLTEQIAKLENAGA